MARTRLYLVGLPLVCASLLAAQTGVTYSGAIAPLVNAHCTSCHRTGGAGPFPLDSYEDVRKHARQIVSVTARRYMPPWLPEQGYGQFAGELRLTDQQIQTIGAWVRQGAPKGETAPPSIAPVQADRWTLGPPDVVVQAGQPFEVPASGGDVFWNFIFRPNLQRSRYVRAVEIRPSNKRLIHHANAIIDRTGSMTQPFAGMEVAAPRGPLDFDGYFLFYKPGSASVSEPEGYSWRIDPGASIILNTHIQPSGKKEMERPEIALYFTDTPPRHFPYLLELQADDELDIPAGAADFAVSDDFKLPIDTQILAIYPHAHYLGKRLEAFATLPDGSRQWLIRIPAWDPAWQGVYHYRQPVDLPAGSVISMRYRYDNSRNNPRNPNRPPRRVRGGDRATDEMAHLWLQIQPRSDHESRSQYAKAWAVHALEKNPANYAAALTLGSIALAQFEPLQAITPLRNAVQLNGDDAIARNLYGAALSSVGRSSEALAQFERAVALKPDFANARLNLARSLAKAGMRARALENVDLILKMYPNDVAAKALLNRLQVQ